MVPQPCLAGILKLKLSESRSARPHVDLPVADGATEMLWLLGQPHLADYLSFLETKVIGGDREDMRACAAEWRAVNDLYYDLEQTEAGIADSIDCRRLPKRLGGLAAELEANPWFKSSFDNLPYSIELVELDKLVVSQIQVENGHSRLIAECLGPKPSPSELFKFCLPVEPKQPPVDIRRLSSTRYLFSSPSSDFRSHDPRFISAADIGHLIPAGPVAGFFGVSVGFGSNFLSGVRSGSRVLLQNGYHRSYALRSAGFTHAWCVVEEVTRKDELKLTATGEVAADPEFYFAAKRPPILRDFFDERICKQLLVRPMDCVVEVEINIRSSNATRV